MTHARLRSSWGLVKRLSLAAVRLVFNGLGWVIRTTITLFGIACGLIGGLIFGFCARLFAAIQEGFLVGVEFMTGRSQSNGNTP